MKRFKIAPKTIAMLKPKWMGLRYDEFYFDEEFTDTPVGEEVVGMARASRLKYFEYKILGIGIYGIEDKCPQYHILTKSHGTIMLFINTSAVELDHVEAEHAICLNVTYKAHSYASKWTKVNAEMFARELRKMTRGKDPIFRSCKPIEVFIAVDAK